MEQIFVAGWKQYGLDVLYGGDPQASAPEPVQDAVLAVSRPMGLAQQSNGMSNNGKAESAPKNDPVNVPTGSSNAPTSNNTARPAEHYNHPTRQPISAHQQVLTNKASPRPDELSALWASPRMASLSDLPRRMTESLIGIRL